MSATGTVITIDRAQQRGTIRGDDDRVRHFEREGMVLWLQFDDLRPGVRVRYEVEATGSAFNVERL